MKEGPSAAMFRRSRQTTQSCIGGKAVVVSVWAKGSIMSQVFVGEVSESEPSDKASKILGDDIKTAVS
jgi:hypothetical protein